AIGLFNLSGNPLPVDVRLEDLGIKGKWMMRDVWIQKDLGMVQTHFSMKVLPHGARLLVFRKP
ncbi:MAG: alpha-galactosidase, partial [Bacteroidota bacterium]